MNKKHNKQMADLLILLATTSFIITFAYGLMYYRSKIDDSFLYILTVLQNSIEAFAFESNLSFSDIAAEISSADNLFYKIFAYVYALSCFVAPYCTLSFCYRIIRKLFLTKRFFLKYNNYRHIIVFGYNSEVKSLLSEKTISLSDRKVKIHLVTDEKLSEQDLSLLIGKHVCLHELDILSVLKDDEKLHLFMKKIELNKAENILLFEESASRNFSVYMKLNDIYPGYCSADTGLKVTLRCEDEGIRKIIENYHDCRVKEEKTTIDLELLSIPELRVRKVLIDKPLHSHYLVNGQTDPNDWDLHLLIVGFGKLGQQFLLQAMNLGVTGSKNRLIIDVIDSDIDNKKSIFKNQFDESYFSFPDEDTIRLGGDKADGELLIRFGNMDIRYKEFNDQLKAFCQDEGMFTYVAICIEDVDISLHCLTEINRFIKKYEVRSNTSLSNIHFAVRMDFDSKMSEYINCNEDTFQKVIAIGSSSEVVSIPEIINNEMSLDAKNYNHTYNLLSLSSTDEVISKQSDQNIDDEWNKLSLFRRNANRAAAARSLVNRDVMKHITQEELDKWFGESGSMLKHADNTWTYDISKEEFAILLSNLEKYPVPSELARMEHRRWCYYTASCGWGCTESPEDKKNDELMQNPCLRSWDELAKYLPEYCIYDIMPTLYEYDRRHKEK